MAISEQVEDIDDVDDGEYTLEEYIEQKVEEKVEERVATETADLRRELEAERTRRRMLERVVAENDRQRVSIRKNSVTHTQVNHLAQSLTGASVDDYSEDPMARRSDFADVREELNEITRTIDEHDDALDAAGHGKPDGKADAWQRVVEAANNLYGSSAENTVDVDGQYDVVLYWRNIQQATGYSERYCKKLLSDFGGDKRGTEWKKHEPPSENNKGNVRRKRLYVDLDVWGNE